MAEITAKLVNELRARTGQGMMECKKMLVEHNGDIEAAITAFRKKGISSKVSARAASEGRVTGVVAADGKAGAVVELNCNTDFTAKSEPFRQLALKAAQALLTNPAADLANVPEIAAGLVEVSQQTGENVRLGKTAYLANPAGRVGLYLYGVTGKIGVLSSVTGNPSDDLLLNIGIHVTAKTPLALALRREDLPADVVAKEKEIAVAQAMATGKPQNIAEKIAEGKMRTFFEERALLEQEFVNPDKFKGTVAEMLKAAGCTLEKYVRMEVGQE